MKNLLKVLALSLLFILAVSCKKENTIPVVTTSAVTEITQTTATSGGNVSDDGGSTITSRGVCWSLSAMPTISDKKTTETGGSGAFISHITDLTVNTLYYVRAYATNSVGTAYGNQISFTTSPIAVPALTTKDVVILSNYIISTGGNITSDNGGDVTARGVCWSRSPNPDITNYKTSNETGIGTFVGFISYVAPNSVYYIRAYATNSAGTGYGNEITYTNPDYPVIFNNSITYGSVSDVDNNSYKTVVIGTQTWMAENLKSTKFNDGSSIPLVAADGPWSALTTPGYCYTNNDIGFKLIYGNMYNFYAVNTGKLCPTGWHVPTQAEVTTFVNYLGTDGGGNIKEIGTTHWTNPNVAATNATGFTALPAPPRQDNGFFNDGSATYTIWWTSTGFPQVANFFGMVNQRTELEKNLSATLKSGFYVRCLKD
jgi:uncharacterized protein (TIGR02145 family)